MSIASYREIETPSLLVLVLTLKPPGYCKPPLKVNSLSTKNQVGWPKCRYVSRLTLLLEFDLLD